ncbi:MAG: hypothetical protein JO130_13140 [Solirubrobacterales bacterium]|nr:hypothetical protein [Solirubrobacterales bacterium]
MPSAAIAGQWYTVAAALIALFGVLIALIVNGVRAERQRKRDLHARALAAITAYGEMPYRIRRRPHCAEHRARLSDELSLTKAEVDTCQVLLAADGDERLSDAFDALYAVARRIVGKEAHEAWKSPVIESDEQMNQGELYRRLSEFTSQRDAFADHLRVATLPAPRRLSRWIRLHWAWTAKLPRVRTPMSAEQRQIVAPQDLARNPSGQDGALGKS